MSYEYTDPKRANDDHALPDVEVFEEKGSWNVIDGVNTRGYGTLKEGFYYAFGLPGCLWDSDPIGPFETYELALEDARESVGGYDNE